MRAIRHAVLVAVAAVILAPSPARAAGEFVYPISGRLTSTYYSPRSYGNHGALDIATTVNTPVGAARGGRVSFRGWSGGYGNLVKIDHGSGYETYYAHLNAFRVSHGQQVSTGTTIGLEGSTGNSTGPHVHFEVRRWGSKQYLPGTGGNNVTKGRAIPQTYSGLSGTSAPAPTTNTGRQAYRVTASALNVRSGPSTGYRVLGSMARGTVVVSFGSSGAWKKIYFDGQTAWCHGGYLERRNGVTAEEVTATGLNVRTGPSTGYAKVGLAHRGETYARTSTSGSWRKVYFDGQQRWFHGGYSRTVTIP